MSTQSKFASIKVPKDIVRLFLVGTTLSAIKKVSISISFPLQFSISFANEYRLGSSSTNSNGFLNGYPNILTSLYISSRSSFSNSGNLNSTGFSSNNERVVGK